MQPHLKGHNVEVFRVVHHLCSDRLHCWGCLLAAQPCSIVLLKVSGGTKSASVALEWWHSSTTNTYETQTLTTQAVKRISMWLQTPGHSLQGNLPSACFPSLHQWPPFSKVAKTVALFTCWLSCSKTRRVCMGEHSVRLSGLGSIISAQPTDSIAACNMSSVRIKAPRPNLLDHVDLAVVPWVEFKTRTLLWNGLCVVAVHTRLQPRGVNHCFLQGNAES